jgi:hypothetical protein
LLWIENVPDITGAPSGSSASVVKLILPCMTWSIYLLLLFLLFWLEPWPWFGYLAQEQSRAKWLGLPQMKQHFVLLRPPAVCYLRMSLLAYLLSFSWVWCIWHGPSVPGQVSEFLLLWLCWH